MWYVNCGDRATGENKMRYLKEKSRKYKMKRLTVYSLILVLTAGIYSCEKEYSTENTDNGNNPLIIGTDCRISKMVWTDSATGAGIGSLAANINAADNAIDITRFDSLAFVLDFNAQPQYVLDTVYIDPDQYFVTDLFTKRVSKFHGLIDPSDPTSPQYDVYYVYSGAGYLTDKFYRLSSAPAVDYYVVNYTYTNNNVTHMTATDAFTGDLVTDADVTYHTNIIPKRFIYIFPDERVLQYFTQFYNFGNRPSNAVKNMVVRNYDPGNVVRDSSVSTFDTYVLSRDNYVLSVVMKGDDQFSIPATKSKILFSYKCK